MWKPRKCQGHRRGWLRPTRRGSGVPATLAHRARCARAARTVAPQPGPRPPRSDAGAPRGRVCEGGRSRAGAWATRHLTGGIPGIASLSASFPPPRPSAASLGSRSPLPPARPRPSAKPREQSPGRATGGEPGATAPPRGVCLGLRTLHGPTLRKGGVCEPREGRGATRRPFPSPTSQVKGVTLYL